MSTSSKSKNAGREVISLDAQVKQKRDALPEPTTYELFGVEFTLPPIKSLPWSVQERVGNLNNTIDVLEDTLGPDKVKELYSVGIQLGDLEVIAIDWQKRSGLEPGESQASAGS
ncbi:hypothetical protein EF913_28205 [Streptomyces sp. WAC04189]|uniref:hypothetical protein n=1 Tax=Streptomyces TaxID=1883 RepID=UPI000F941B4C|nr:hypothetical protein [Streptomyces sp. WAC04189]RSR98015.1 hypothetical protein EF913_28205 [Streptomyces sp. WAC04189]